MYILYFERGDGRRAYINFCEFTSVGKVNFFTMMEDISNSYIKHAYRFSSYEDCEKIVQEFYNRMLNRSDLSFLADYNCKIEKV